MDDTVNRLAKELAQAIAAAVAADANVEACRARARAAGYELHLSIEAEVGFANRGKTTALVRARRPQAQQGQQAEQPVDASQHIDQRPGQCQEEELADHGAAVLARRLARSSA